MAVEQRHRFGQPNAGQRVIVVLRHVDGVAIHRPDIRNNEIKDTGETALNM